MILLALLACLVAPSPPRMPPDLEAVLRAASDRGDIGDEAFRALLDEVATWPPSVSARTLPAPTGDLVSSPSIAPLRGRLFGLRGRLVRARPVAGMPGVEEWALRDGDGQVWLVYAEALPSVSPGAALEIPARLYKRLRLRDESGVERNFVAFVGACAARSDEAPARSGYVVVGMVFILAVAFLFVQWRLRGRRAARRYLRAGAFDGAGRADGAFGPEGALPEDPADALRILHRGRPGEDQGPSGPESM